MSGHAEECGDRGEQVTTNQSRDHHDILTNHRASLHTALGRVYLQLGNLTLADQSFSEAAKIRDNSVMSQVEALLDSAFLAVGQGQFETALERFSGAEQTLVSSADTDHSLGKMISNNIAVCLLYVGRLKEGLQRLEKDITQDPSDIQVRIQNISSELSSE